MSSRCTLTTVSSRYTDSESLRLEGRVCSSPVFPMTMTSRSPVSSPSWDISSESSAESGFVPDAPTAEPIPEQIGFGGMYYDHVQTGHYHHRWEFSDTGHEHSVPPRIQGHPQDVPVGPSPHAVGSRGELTRPYLRYGNDEISYTDEANTKLSNRIRRRCFNCKATETSTWRRSVLSPGKLVSHRSGVPERTGSLRHPQLCNKCGLFERTHSIPRPQKFPRRRTHGSKALRNPPAHPDMRTLPGSDFVNRHSKDSRSSSLPIATHLLHALDPISGEIFPQHMPWNSPDAPDSASARVNRRHPTTEQPAIYHADGQLPSTALPGAIWI
jgi:hypothetical protein